VLSNKCISTQIFENIVLPKTSVKRDQARGLWLANTQREGKYFVGVLSGRPSTMHRRKDDNKSCNGHTETPGE
jgi:hypothetical protein